MGLDQYWLAENEENSREHFAYHRKFNALEGFMAGLWHESHNGEFNCEELEINHAILDRLEELARNKSLEPTSGFFFGSTEKDMYYEEDLEDLLNKVIPAARERLNNGKRVFYSSWW